MSLAAQLSALFDVPIDDSPTLDAPTEHEPVLPRVLDEALLAKMDDLLDRPIWSAIPGTGDDSESHTDPDDHFDFFESIAPSVATASPLQPDGEGRCRVPVAFDTDDAWRGREKELIDALQGGIDERVWLLTTAQWRLLLRSPRELLGLHPAPWTARLLEVETAWVGGRELPVAVLVGELADTPSGARYLALVPNLAPLRRMREGLQTLTDPCCPAVLAPLQAILGIGSRDLPVGTPPAGALPERPHEQLDAHQRACVHRVLHTPHFALVQGPPGSGKTTVIKAIIEREVARGHRVLVVSPTHVAVDNVVEKLWPAPDSAPSADSLAPHTLPVRWAARDRKLSPHARLAWESGARSVRTTELAKRLEQTLCGHETLGPLWQALDPSKRGGASLTQALAERRQVVCGTPIGVLSCSELAAAGPADFDLLIVDEVSKLTVPEFLAVAVKARRWALIGDPEQLPPYLDAREASVCLARTYGRIGELAASVSALIERRPPQYKSELRLVAVSATPDAAADAIRHQLKSAGVRASLGVSVWPGLANPHQPGICVCAASDVDEASAALAPRERRRSLGPAGRRAHPGTVWILPEEGVAVARPGEASGTRLVDDADRAPARLVGLCHDILHTLPWATAVGVRPPSLGRRKGLPKLLPQTLVGADVAATHADLARLFVLLGVSVYDWIAGVPEASWPEGPLRHLTDVLAPVEPLREAVAPWCSTLRTQYRMHPAVSAVPRALFYDGDALKDGRRQPGKGGVHLVQITPEGPVGEDNRAEAERIVRDLQRLDGSLSVRAETMTVLVITPYRRQEVLLRRLLANLQQDAPLKAISAEVCTLDRCQGREASVVMVSLVRGRASAFLDNPKRWNVALTRARSRLFVYGDLAAHRRGSREHSHPRGPKQSVVATFLAAYARK